MDVAIRFKHLTRTWRDGITHGEYSMVIHKWKFAKGCSGEGESTGTDNVKNYTDDNAEDDAMNKFDLAKDSIGAKYMQMENSVLYLGECCICQGRKA